MPSSGGTRGQRQFRRRFSLQASSLLGREDSNARALSPSKEEAEVGKQRHKIVVMGPSRAGKTSLISQFLYGQFPERYKRTVEEMYNGEFDVGGVRLTLDILDTAGENEFPAMRALSISSADAFILVYALDEPEASFEEVRSLRDLILATKGRVPIVVVGNKLDLVKDNNLDRETVESIVTLDWEHGYVQVSAKDNINVAKSFQELLNQAKVKYDLSPALRQRRRRQSLPAVAGSSPGATPTPPPPKPPQADVEKLDKVRGDKRNSCVVS